MQCCRDSCRRAQAVKCTDLWALLHLHQTLHWECKSWSVTMIKLETEWLFYLSFTFSAYLRCLSIILLLLLCDLNRKFEELIGNLINAFSLFLFRRKSPPKMPLVCIWLIIWLIFSNRRTLSSQTSRFFTTTTTTYYFPVCFNSEMI